MTNLHRFASNDLSSLKLQSQRKSMHVGGQTKRMLNACLKVSDFHQLARG